MNLKQVCCRLYPFISLDNNKGRTWKFLWWTYPTLGEPHISLSLLYYVYFVFYFCICFILLLCDPIFLTYACNDSNIATAYRKRKKVVMNGCCKNNNKIYGLQNLQ
jgi:hypothetical protein